MVRGWQETATGSPAMLAGLQPYSDYILSAVELIFKDEEDLVSRLPVGLRVLGLLLLLGAGAVTLSSHRAARGWL